MQDWNHKPFGPKALFFVIDITTMLYGGALKAVETYYLLSLLTFTSDVFFMQGKKTLFLLPLYIGSQGKITLIFFWFGLSFTIGLKRVCVNAFGLKRVQNFTGRKMLAWRTTGLENNVYSCEKYMQRKIRRVSWLL